jgi:hypothetical protein
LVIFTTPFASRPESDDGRVGADLVRLQHLGFECLRQQRVVQLRNRLGSTAGGDLHERRRVRHRHPERDPTEALPGDRVRDLTAQRLEAQAIAELQEHEPQVGLDRHRGPAEERVEVLSIGGEEHRVVEQAVDRLKLGGEPEAHLGQDGLPQGGLRAYRSQHDGLDPY